MRKNIKVAVLIDAWFPIYGGGQVHVLEISKRIAKKNNFYIEIITSNLGNSNSYFDGNLVNKKSTNFKIVRLGPSFSFGNPLGRMAYLFLTFLYLLQREFDIIHAHAFLPGFPAKIISLIKGRPVIFTVHGIAREAWSGMRSSTAAFFFRYIEGVLLFKILYDWQITVSQDFLRLKNINKNIAVINNGVNIKEFDNLKVRKSRGFKVLFVGRLHSQKGLVYLLRALKNVRKKIPNVQLTLVGEGPQKTLLLSEIKRLEIGDLVFFKGRLEGEDLIREYKSAHLFVLPSLYEGFPLTLLEAWAAKLPIIVTKVGENGYLIREGENGYLVPPKNVNRLTQKIIDCAKNSKVSILGQRGYKDTKEKYSWDIAAKQTLEIYSRVLNK